MFPGIAYSRMCVQSQKMSILRAAALILAAIICMHTSMRAHIFFTGTVCHVSDIT